MRRLRTLLGLLLLTVLAAPAAAHAGASEDFLQVYKAYQGAGEVDGCAFSGKKLASARKGVPPDIDTYAPDFPDALDAALRQRASGDCDGSPAASGARKAGAPAAGGAPASGVAVGIPVADGGPPALDGGPAPEVQGATGATGAAGAPGTTPAPPPEAAPGPGAADGSVAAAAARNARSTATDDVPAVLVLLAILAVLALLAAALWALLRVLALDPPWLERGRHATAEAGWRASASWAEFTDWVRLGR